MAKETGGPAFPELSESYVDRDDNTHYNVSASLTVRDYFAAKAMQGICAHPDRWGLMAPGIAAHAYEIADAMLAERSKP